MSALEESHRFRCPECGRMVTRGPDGTEYGHAASPGESKQDLEGRCPRRPRSVDPNHPNAAQRAAIVPTAERDDRGRFA